MKTKQLFYAILFFIGLSATAQQAPFMVCNATGTTCTPATTLNAAYNAAVAGDYIYLPAGDFYLSNTINKEVHFIGAGFDINASITTGITRISGDLIIGTSGNGSSFEGFYLTGNIRNFGNVNNITLSYLNFNRLVYYSQYSAWNWSNSVVKNCVVRDDIHFGDDYYKTYGENNLVMNSFVKGIQFTNHSTIKNCIISEFTSENYCFNYINNTVIKNCIIGAQGLNAITSNNSDNVTFLNNATKAVSGQLINGKSGSNEVNNSYGITAADTFVTATAFTYNLTFDYHIKTTSPAYNGGDNGGDMGIYGGNTPWKEGAIPSNPHIFFKNISNATDTNGNLPVQIKVSTQY
jgi:hypothetical protein